MDLCRSRSQSDNRPCLRHSDAAEDAVLEMFVGSERDAVEDLLGQIFHVNEIEVLHVKQIKPIRFMRDQTYEARVDAHRDELGELVEQIITLPR
jgi:hypothetical protein